MTNDNKNKKTVLLSGLAMMIVALLTGGFIMAEEKNQPTEPGNVLVIDTEAATSAFVLPAAGQFTLKLPSNPSTGYSWEVDITKLPAAGPVQFKGRVEEINRQEEPPMFGAPAYDLFIFEAVGTGEVIITLDYRRPWEKDLPPFKIHQVHITIKSGF